MIVNPNGGNGPQVEQATPQISVSAAGLITAKTEQEKGYVPGGTKSSTKQLPTQAAKTVTPGTTNQTAVASGRYTTGAVTVKGDANLKAENIAEGVSIFGVTGTHSGGGETYTVTSDDYNIFYPQEAVPGQYVVTISGTYYGSSINVLNNENKTIAHARAALYKYLPSKVKEEIAKYPTARVPPMAMDGYAWFVMPQEDVSIQTLT